MSQWKFTNVGNNDLYKKKHDCLFTYKNYTRRKWHDPKGHIPFCRTAEQWAVPAKQGPIRMLKFYLADEHKANITWLLSVYIYIIYLYIFIWYNTTCLFTVDKNWFTDIVHGRPPPRDGAYSCLRWKMSLGLHHIQCGDEGELPCYVFFPMFVLFLKSPHIFLNNPISAESPNTVHYKFAAACKGTLIICTLQNGWMNECPKVDCL